MNTQSPLGKYRLMNVLSVTKIQWRKNSKKNFQTPLIMGAQNTRSTHVFASRKQVPLVNFVGMPLQRMLSLTKLLFVSRPTFASPQQIRHKSPPSFQQEKYPLCLDKPLFQLIWLYLSGIVSTFYLLDIIALRTHYPLQPTFLCIKTCPHWSANTHYTCIQIRPSSLQLITIECKAHKIFTLLFWPWIQKLFLHTSLGKRLWQPGRRERTWLSWRDVATTWKVLSVLRRVCGRWRAHILSSLLSCPMFQRIIACNYVDRVVLFVRSSPSIPRTIKCNSQCLTMCSTTLNCVFGRYFQVFPFLLLSIHGIDLCI